MKNNLPPDIIKIGNCVPSNHRAGNVYDPNGIAPTIMENHGYPAFIIEEQRNTDRLIQVAQIYDQEQNPTNGRVYDPDGISPTLTTPTGGNSMPLILTTEESEQTMNSKLKEMLEDGQIPMVDGLWIDTYNKGVNPDVAGTLRTTIDSANMHYVMECAQIPFNTADDGLAYTITTRYGAMCVSNLRDGNFPMTGILEIENPTEEMIQQIEDGSLNFDKGLPKEPKSCAVRGRETDSGNMQMLEVGSDVANALTTVQKDSLVIEPMIIGYSRDEKGKIVSRHFNDIAGTLHGSSCTGGNTSQYVAESKEPEPTILSIVPWNRPGGDVGAISPAITTSAWEHNNFVKEPGAVSVMADPRKNYGRIQPSTEASPTLLSTDYKSPHLVMENPDVPTEVLEAAERLHQIAEASRGGNVSVTINPDYSLRPHKLNKAKDGISELCTDFDESIGSTNIAARPNNVYGTTTKFRIRKLTPRECYRLMDVPEPIINRMLNSGISKSQHYKLAGNSIVVACLYHIFKSLFTNEIPANQQLSLF